MLRVRTLEADRHVGERVDAVEVDEHGDQPLLPLGIPERALQQRRLSVLPRCVQADVVAPDCLLEELVRLRVAIEDVVRRDRAGVDERVDVDDHGATLRYRTVRHYRT